MWKSYNKVRFHPSKGHVQEEGQVVARMQIGLTLWCLSSAQCPYYIYLLENLDIGHSLFTSSVILDADCGSQVFRGTIIYSVFVKKSIELRN